MIRFNKVLNRFWIHTYIHYDRIHAIVTHESLSDDHEQSGIIQIVNLYITSCRNAVAPPTSQNDVRRSVLVLVDGDVVVSCAGVYGTSTNRWIIAAMRRVSRSL